MAVLSATELQAIRQGCELTVGFTLNATKPQINLAAQAVEDFITNNAATVSTLINTATSPFVFTAAQKKTITAYVVLMKYLRDK